MIENSILQSVVDITKQRDLDSLECSLVATLAELLPVVSVSILKSVKEDNAVSVEEVIRLDIDKKNEEPYSWSVDAVLMNANGHYSKCVNHSKAITYKHEQGFSRLLFPISDDKHTIGCLAVDSFKDLSSHMMLIEGFVRIYENYVIVFNESEKDKLTGLYNRRTFDNKLQNLFKKQKYKKQQAMKSLGKSDRRHYETNDSAWLIMTDIDHFKSVNDTYGHAFGDEVLLIIAQKMKSCFRSTDLLFRIGGEEFVILLEPVTQNVAEELVDRFRRIIAEHEFSQIGTVTISAGYVRISEKDYPPDILECADKALYYAKEHGRNCFYSYETLVESGKIEPPKKRGVADLF